MAVSGPMVIAMAVSGPMVIAMAVSCSKLDGECRSKGWSVISLYVEVTAHGGINTTYIYVGYDE